jgi:hypothetical protein
MALPVRFLFLALCAPGMALFGQTSAGLSNVSTTASAAPGAATLPSTTLQPSLDVLKTAVADVRVERWKGSAALRTETETNLASIQRDLNSTLPPLLAAADSAPDSAAKVLPAYRNIEALYDVLLRVTSAGKVAAPGDQSSSLDQALTSLEDGRRALGDRLQTDSAAEEKKVSDLQAALKAIPPPAPPPAPPTPAACPTPPAKKKAKPAAKPTPPPASTTPSQ